MLWAVEPNFIVADSVRDQEWNFESIFLALVLASRSLLHYWGFAMDYMTFLFIQPKTTMQHNDKQRERKIPCEISQLAINSASKKLLLYKIFPALIELFLLHCILEEVICSLFWNPTFLEWFAMKSSSSFQIYQNSKLIYFK